MPLEKIIVQGPPSLIPLADLSAADVRYLQSLPQLQTSRKPAHLEIATRAHAGTIQLSRLRLEIRPKIQPDRWRDTLFHMLAETRHTHLRRLPRPASYTSSSTVFFQTITYLLDALDELTAYGLLRRYQPHQDRLPVLRGRLRLAEATQITFDGRLPCRYYDLSADILENRLIRTTLEKLVRLLLPSRLSARVSASLSLFEGIQHCRGTENIHYHRLNERYRTTHVLCRLLLENLYTAFGAGATPYSSFLVDMEKLFEDYVAALLRRHYGTRKLIRTQSPIRILGAPDNRIRSITLRPDILICDPVTRTPELVLDTKYKISTPLNRFGGETARHSDFYQVLTYALLHQCPGVLIYPQHEFSAVPLSESFTAQGHEVILVTTDLSVPIAQIGLDFILQIARVLP